MTSLAAVRRCPPRRLIAESSPGVWLALHLMLYVLLDAGMIAVLAAVDGDRGANIAGTVAVSIGWALPLHVAVLLPAAAALMFLRVLTGLRWYWFRLSALAVFVLPAGLLAWVLSSGDADALRFAVAWHILMALLVVRPNSDWATTDPSPDQHRW
ncbi:hypothetical protein AB0J83_48325 [Actinoplanes sp. NPDC049596]|uniref:hypothetical protein n=1 Tax=unclassified Actinoplanes TaxID=2626549 RepID=UPI00343A3F41